MEKSLLCLVVLLTLQSSLAIHTLVGEALAFASEQEDVSIFATDVNGNNNNLVLTCAVTGDPVTVNWFREGTQLNSSYVQADGSLLVVNITEGEFATTSGVVYYCEATREVGATPFSATIRSRDINVTYSFFEGFEDRGEVFIPTGNPAEFAIRCDVLDSSPAPEIVWFRGDAPDTPIVAVAGLVIFLENSRYLYIRGLTDLPQTYRCGVTNAMGDRPMMSGTTYTVNGTGLAGGLHVYKEIGDLEIFESDYPSFQFSYVAANNMLPQACSFQIGTTSVFALGGLAQIQDTTTIPPSPSELSCRTGTNGPIIGNPGMLTINRRAQITGNPMSEREVIVGEENNMVQFDCSSTGSPSPTVTWYYNGAPAAGITGITINDGILTIAVPMVSHSGMYQCFVSNGISQTSAAVLLEARAPVAPVISPLIDDNPTATDDRQVGTLFIGPFESAVDVTVRVEADPCPNTVTWSFRGETLQNNALYTFNNPCSDISATSPFTYTFRLANLSADTSGAYFANFTNLAGTAQLTRLYMTIPMMPETVSSGISVSVDNSSDSMCLLNNSDSRITCNVNGFPRPTVEFRRRLTVITPGSGDFTAFSQPFPDQLLITDVDESFADTYTCEATPPQGSPGPSVTHTEMFQFCTIPIVVSSNGSSNTFVGDVLQLECEIRGIPDPTDSWEKDGVRLVERADGSLTITNPSNNPAITRLRINSAQLSDDGSYRCIGTNLAGSVSMDFQVDVNDDGFGPLSLEHIIGIAAGGAGLILLIVLIILLMVCVYMCAKRNSKASMDLPYNVPGNNFTDYGAGDGRGNVDRDSDEEDGGKPEAFNPEYESLPALRPAQPPMYKPTPSYPHGAPLSGDDIEMIKVPPPDNDSFVGYRRDNVDYRPSSDDFLSEDAQFV